MREHELSTIVKCYYSKFSVTYYEETNHFPTKVETYVINYKYLMTYKANVRVLLSPFELRGQWCAIRNMKYEYESCDEAAIVVWRG